MKKPCSEQPRGHTKPPFRDLQLESYSRWRDLIFEQINYINNNINTVNNYIFCYKQAYRNFICIGSRFSYAKDSWRWVCGYSLPSAKNCYKCMESLQQFAIDREWFTFFEPRTVQTAKNEVRSGSAIFAIQSALLQRITPAKFSKANHSREFFLNYFAPHERLL